LSIQDAASIAKYGSGGDIIENGLDIDATLKATTREKPPVGPADETVFYTACAVIKEHTRRVCIQLKPRGL
jgi:hypothetical protein